MLNLPFYYYVFVCIPPGKAIPEMTYTVPCGTLNRTHSLTVLWCVSCFIYERIKLQMEVGDCEYPGVISANSLSP